SINHDNAFIYGANFFVFINLNKHLLIKQSVHYTFGRVKTDSINLPLDHIPPFFGRFSISYKAKKINSEVYCLFNSWKHLRNYSNSGEDNIQYATQDGMPSWSTWNIRTAYQFNKQIALSLAIEN